MSDKEPRDYWSDCGQVFFHYGKGYGVTPGLKTIFLGDEQDILSALDGGRLKEDLTALQRQCLAGIIEYRKEEGIGISAGGLGKGSVERDRPHGSVRANQAAARPSKTKQRLPVRPTRATVKNLSRQ